ncbi:unnamed protein product [Aphanomyces euteiches]|uniref:Uncharacterized protein n=1 Tax=Aphanomyces euteiches TaxID=100861 RepID=A0A6G0X755_9STRA|nr:hypothetical protein Ae201684_007732 [Aphanomyces euteiches]KAH9067381.1 hypothetical protein Ae201684P_021540 [Aphanomyces euteiches]KAH9112057.1 hypothetical protein AeMF1_013559 [Aphanomyces euteiches]KAH9130479.1 hypothetical protein LEN26_008488 [Aphanomyces euteiches]KAH9142917.1 hypothetical protein AeRB84_013037 [Aphanomyces euteiches]
MRAVRWTISAAMFTPCVAECWLRNDGVRICSADGLEWLAMWWFWFAVLFFLIACTGGSYIYHRRHINSLYQQGFVTYSEPLILNENVKKSSPILPKIFYR